MEKLNEVKETYAKELGYKDWETCINDQPNYKVETLMDEVALRLYSVSTRLLADCRNHYLLCTDFETGEPKASMQELLDHWQEVNTLLNID